MAKRGYHHGNLRAALIEAALELIVEKGPTGFTLSQAARKAGVTPAAVYRHFRGREDLIAAIAREGYTLFGRAMEAATASAPSPLSAFEASGRAYLDFARSHPGHYMAMFESGLPINRDPELARLALGAQATLERHAEALLSVLPPEARPPASMVAAHIWAMSHGVVELFARASPGSRAPFPPEELLETGIGLYLRGLGVLGGGEECGG